MSDQRLDVPHRALLDRRRRQRMVRFVRPGGHVIEALLDDPQTLAHLGYAHDGAVITIAALRSGNLELELIVAGVRPPLAEVPLESAGAQARACHAPLDSLIQRVSADADGARFEDAVLHDQPVVLIQPPPHIRDEVSDRFVPALWQVLRHAADAEPTRVHAPAAHGLDDVEDALAVGEHIEHRRERSDVLREGTVPDQVAGQSKELRHHDANHLHAVWDFDPGELLYRQDIGQVVHHSAEVIHAVGVGKVGVPRLALAHLFGPAMVIADVRHDVHYLFAAELEREAQHAMRARMLRPQIEEHKIRVLASTLKPPVFRAELQRRLFGLFLLFGQTEWLHLGGARRMFLTQGMTMPGRRRQDASQVRMAGEGDSEHIPHFALVPVGRGPDVSDGFERRALASERHFDPDILVALEGEQVINDCEIAYGLIIAVVADALVNGR